MKKLLLFAVAVALLFSVSCGTSDITPIESSGKTLSSMTDTELRLMADKYGQTALTDKFTPQTTASALMAIMYQNELILRALEEKKK